MSLGKIQSVFESFVWGTGIKFTISKKTGISYTGREINFSPDVH